MTALATAIVKTKVKRGPKPKVGGMSASDFVRSQPIDIPVPEMRAAAKKLGIEMSSGLVYMVRGKMRDGDGTATAPKRKPGRKPKAGAAPAPKGKPGRRPKAVAAAAGTSDAVALKKLAYGLGIPRAKALIVELEAALANLFT